MTVHARPRSPVERTSVVLKHFRRAHQEEGNRLGWRLEPETLSIGHLTVKTRFPGAWDLEQGCPKVVARLSGDDAQTQLFVLEEQLEAADLMVKDSKARAESAEEEAETLEWEAADARHDADRAWEEWEKAEDERNMLLHRIGHLRSMTESGGPA